MCWESFLSLNNNSLHIFLRCFLMAETQKKHIRKYKMFLQKLLCYFV